MNLKYIFLKIINIIFPFPELYKAQKKINAKIEELNNSTQEVPYNYEYASNNKEIDSKILLDTLKNTIENKKILEDKAKSSLIAITISSTLIINIVKFVQEVKDNSTFFAIILLVVGFFSLLYMIIAGVLSLYNIGEINTLAIMHPEDYLLSEQNKKTEISNKIEFNYLSNLKRNNFMNTSYRCMITSLVFLIIVFLISTIIVLKDYNKEDEIQLVKKEIEIIKDKSNEVQKLKKKVDSISKKISNLDKKISTDRQTILDIKNQITDIEKDNKKIQEKYNDIKVFVEKINQILTRNLN